MDALFLGIGAWATTLLALPAGKPLPAQFTALFDEVLRAKGTQILLTAARDRVAWTNGQ